METLFWITWMGPVSPQGSWKSLNHVPPNSHVEILSPRISAQDLIWKQSDWRCNLLRWGHTWVQCPPIAVWLCCLVTKCVWLFATPWTAAHQVPLPSTISRSLLKLMSIELVMLSAHLILCCPPLLLPSVSSMTGTLINGRNLDTNRQRRSWEVGGRGQSHVPARQGMPKIANKPFKVRWDTWNRFFLIALRRNQPY